MLGTSITDDVESGAGEVAGLDLLPVTTDVRSREDPPHGVAATASSSTAPSAATRSATAAPTRHGGAAADHRRRRDPGGLRARRDLRHLLARRCSSTTTPGARCCAGSPPRRAIDFVPAPATSFAAERDRQLDRLGDLVEEHLDTERLRALIEHGVPADLPDLLLERAQC